MVRRQPLGQPHQLHVAPGFSLDTATRLNTVEVGVDIELQQHRGVIGGPARLPRLNTAKAQLGKVKLINKYINDPDRVVFRNVVIQRFGK